MLELKNVTYSVADGDGRKNILSDVSLLFPDKSITVVTGHNGSGKSTLVKLIMGIEKPDSGKILLDGEDITGKSVTDRARMGITLAFQQPVRFKGITVKNLLDLAVGSNCSMGAACEFLFSVGLCAKNYVNRPVDDTLSGGELKRIELALALAKGGNVFLLDEPEAGIDLWSFAKLTETFRYIHEKRQATIIIISHQERIINLADEIVMIAGGEVVERGAKEEMFPKILENTQSGCAFVKGGAQA